MQYICNMACKVYLVPLNSLTNVRKRAAEEGSGVDGAVLLLGDGVSLESGEKMQHHSTDKLFPLGVFSGRVCACV